MSECNTTTEGRLSSEMKARWLEALRSGRYQQGEKALKDGPCFCCLGVALDVIDSAQWGANGWGVRDEHDGPVFSMSDTVELSAQLGVPEYACSLLADMNDGTQTGGLEERRLSFAEIADWIEANL